MSEEKKEFSKKKNSDLLNKIRDNPWMISTIVVGFLLIISITGSSVSVSEEVVKSNALDFLNSKVEGAVVIDSISNMGSYYELMITYDGNQIPVQVTLDGNYLLTGLVPIGEGVAAPSQPGSPSQPSQPQNVPKSDKPVVELFVMTHCPYGTQAEKGYIPTIVALGDKIDASVKFVHYFLHDPEYTETPVQICIREEQSEKFNTYLKEFLAAGDSSAALVKAGVDETALNDCIENRYDEYYVADSALSEGYGVRGSPTLVINGVIAQSGRDSNSYLSTICNAFNNAPSECETLELDSASPGPGFGYGTTSGIANAQC
jgi:protein-disulfide isomerase